MRKIVLLVVCCLMIASCSTTSKLYYWGGTQMNEISKYENLAYKNYKVQTPEAICNLICVYEDMVNHPGGTRKVTPPGVCAEYGYLLLSPGTAETFASNATPTQKKIFESDDYSALFAEKGKKLMEMEIENYPESEQFIKPLIKKLAN